MFCVLLLNFVPSFWSRCLTFRDDEICFADGKEVTWSSVALLLVPLLSHARVCVFTSSLKHNLSFGLSLVWGSICKLNISMNLMLISNLLLPWLVPYIWGRRYSWWWYSSMLPCLLSCPLSDPSLSCLSCMRLSIIGLAALLFFSLVFPHLAFFSLCAPLSFSSLNANL